MWILLEKYFNSKFNILVITKLCRKTFKYIYLFYSNAVLQAPNIYKFHLSTYAHICFSIVRVFLKYKYAYI